jgi:hypothetical protein
MIVAATEILVTRHQAFDEFDGFIKGHAQKLAELTRSCQRIRQFREHIAMTIPRLAPAAEPFVAQLAERRHEMRLPVNPIGVFGNHGGAITVASNDERIAPFGSPIDADIERFTHEMNDRRCHASPVEMVGRMCHKVARDW